MIFPFKSVRQTGPEGRSYKETVLDFNPGFFNTTWPKLKIVSDSQ